MGEINRPAGLVPGNNNILLRFSIGAFHVFDLTLVRQQFDVILLLGIFDLV